ncbi:hypothetical protein AVEN_92189-1 [Araneus ventricosus]|uniref:Uncharacterized protein n=1 Tax=Araneus ventricosus TaxID=182803 RepID=A0A4Y2AK75_ARAVE|nr:hypothetical protein AVEN_92189-1 [Araneus ventricosus]
MTFKFSNSRHHFTLILVEADALLRPSQDSPSSLQLEMGRRKRTCLPDRVVVDHTGDDREGLSVVGSDKMWAGLRRSIEITSNRHSLIFLQQSDSTIK